MKSPWRREWLPTPVFLPGKSHGQRSPVDYSPWGYKELDTIEHVLTHHSLKAKKRWSNQYSGHLIYIFPPLGSLRSPTAGLEKTRTQEVIWRHRPLHSSSVQSFLCPQGGLYFLLLCPLGGCVCVCACVCVCVCVYPGRTFGPVQNVHKTLGPHQRSLKLFPVQNIRAYLVHAQRGFFFFFLNFYYSCFIMLC